jgi:hypothetical protein
MVIVDDWTTAMVTRDSWRREGMLATVARRGPTSFGGQLSYRVRGRYTRLLDGSKPYRISQGGPVGSRDIQVGVDEEGEPYFESKACQTFHYHSDRYLLPDSNPPQFVRLGNETFEAYIERLAEEKRAADVSAEKKEGE